MHTFVSLGQIMGHMDVLPIISDGFNIYFPMAIFDYVWPLTSHWELASLHSSDSSNSLTTKMILRPICLTKEESLSNAVKLIDSLLFFANIYIFAENYYFRKAKTSAS